MITILGATGTVGAQLTALLLDAGQQVRVVGRSAERLRELTARGSASATPAVAARDAAARDAAARNAATRDAAARDAAARAATATAANPDVAVADPADAAALTAALRGASAVWTMMPVDPAAPDHHAAQARIGEATLAAIRAAGVPRVVALSSLGAHLPTGTGFLTELHDQERRLATLTDRDVVVLRPGWFYDNARGYLPTMVEGVVADSLDPDVPVPMVATADVAAVAADALTGGWSGHVVRELLGPVDVDQRTATALLAAAFGRELTYVRLDDDAMVAALVGAGFTADVARRHVGLTAAINEGRIAATGPRAALPTGYPEFAAALARRNTPLGATPATHAQPTG